MKYIKKLLLLMLSFLILISVIIGIYQSKKGLPKGVSVASPVYNTDAVEFITDLTFMDDGKHVMEQRLLEEALAIIDGAEEFILLDMFLYNDDYDRTKGSYPNVAEQITDALVAKRESNPNMAISVISDAVNTLYGSNNSSFFDELVANNIAVILTNMKPLRDSNPLYSSVWRSILQVWRPSQNGFLPNAFNPDGGKGSVGSYLELVNFKANHRKVVMNEQRALLTSANLTHDGSSYHSNIGFVVQGEILKDIYSSEQAVAKMSGGKLENRTFVSRDAGGEVKVQLVTEGKIKEAMLQALTNVKANATVQVGVFYMADRDIVKGLKEAASRGAKVQLILDPNKDAFGIEKNGIPNRQVAAELMKDENVTVRWYDTNGEQYHSKLLVVMSDGEMTVIGGSANFTRRNLADYNLETNILLTLPSTHALAEEIEQYFNRLWTNKDGTFTVEFEKFEDQSLWRKLLYRVQEFTGLSTF